MPRSATARVQTTATAPRRRGQPPPRVPAGRRRGPPDAPRTFVVAEGEAGPSDDFLATYFRDVATVDVMSKEAELEAAVRIAGLRKAFWRTVFAYAPFVEPLCALVQATLPGEAGLAELVEAVRRTSRTLRDRDLVAHQKAFDAARDALSDHIGVADVDGALADRVLADLASLEMGQPDGLSIPLRAPRKGSAPFLQYVAEVRAHHHSLCAAKHAFVKANLRLVVTIARRFGHGRMALQDLIQEGNIGLLKAVDRFDHRRGFRFSTYGSWWIRHAISRAIADKARAVRLPVHMTDAYNKVTRARREFEAAHQRAPSDDELAGLSGVSVDRIERMRWSLLEAPVSLDQPLSADGSFSLADALEDPTQVEAPEQLDQALLMTQLREVFDQLAPIEADILRKRMGWDDEPEMTLKEIGEYYSLSRERIRQLQEQALGKLRSAFRRRDLF